MANLFEYLSWRGDLAFAQAPFNQVDGLILSALAYVPFDGVLPGPESGGALPLAEAAATYFALHPGLPPADTKDFDAHNLLLLDALSRAPRFSALPLSAYVSRVDAAAAEQFAALTAALGPREAFVAFRGTDNTLAGWKEDFNMGFLPQVPSQAAAAAYLSAQARRWRALRTGGHSKGGNLAVYAAAHCGRAQQRLLAVYNNDGPGFSTELMSQHHYLSIRDLVHTFVPQSSVVGLLLNHEEDYIVVHSTQVGLLQHDPYSWEVLGPAFVSLEHVTAGSRFLSATLKSWVSAMDAVQRERFVDGLFQLLSATNASTLDQLSSAWFKTAAAVLQALKDLDGDTRRALTEALKLLLASARQSASGLRTASGQSPFRSVAR